MSSGDIASRQREHRRPLFKPFVEYLPRSTQFIAEGLAIEL